MLPTSSATIIASPERLNLDHFLVFLMDMTIHTVKITNLHDGLTALLLRLAHLLEARLHNVLIKIKGQMLRKYGDYAVSSIANC